MLAHSLGRKSYRPCFRFSSSRWGSFIGFHICGSTFSTNLACCYLPLEVEFREKNGVGNFKGALTAEISFLSLTLSILLWGGGRGEAFEHIITKLCLRIKDNKTFI